MGRPPLYQPDERDRLAKELLRIKRKQAFDNARKDALKSALKRLPKRGPGRPRKADAINRPVTVALSENLVAKLDAWREGKGINRSTAIRRFVEEALKRGGR